MRRSLSSTATRAFRRQVGRTRIERLDLSTNVEIRSSHHGGISNLSLDTQDCRYLLSGGADGSIALCDLDAGVGAIEAMAASHAEPARHTLSVCSLEWYPEDSGAFLSSSLDGRVLVWDTNVFAVAGEFQLGKRIHHASTRAPRMGSGVIACALSDATIRLCDTLTMDSCHVLHGHKDAVMCVAWSPNNLNQLASCSRDGSLKVFDVRKGGSQGELLSFDWHQDHTATAATMFGGKAAAVGISNLSWKQELGSGPPLLQMDRAKELAAKAHVGAIMSIKYTPCGNFLVSSGNDRKVRLWAADTGALSPINYELQSNISSLPYSMEIASFSCSGDDLLLYPNGKSGDIAVVPLHSPSGRAIKVLKGHVASVTSIVYRQSLNQIVSGGRDGMIYLWDAPTKDYASETKSTRALATPGEVAIQLPLAPDLDYWSDDEQKTQTLEPLPSHCFIPPIIQAYLDEQNRSSLPFQSAPARAQKISRGGPKPVRRRI